MTRRELLMTLGVDAAAKLIDARGGTRIYIPVSAGGWPAEMLGPAAAEKLSARWGGEKIDVPMRPVVEAEVLRLADERMSIRRIARRLHICRARVARIVHDTMARQ